MKKEEEVQELFPLIKVQKIMNNVKINWAEEKQIIEEKGHSTMCA